MTYCIEGLIHGRLVSKQNSQQRRQQGPMLHEDVLQYTLAILAYSSLR